MASRPRPGNKAATVPGGATWPAARTGSRRTGSRKANGA